MCLKIKIGEDFARSNINTILIINNNRQMNHKHMNFFSDFDIKRILISRKYISRWYIFVSCWFYTNNNYYVLCSYYIKNDTKNFSFINNKTYEGYYYLFNDI